MGTTCERQLNILKDFPANTHAEWLEAVEKGLKGKSFEKALVKKTYEGIDIQPKYFLQDLDGLPYVDTAPGEPPYIRGTSASGSVVNSWKIAQELTLADPAEFNEAARLDLSRGQNGLHVLFDRASLQGMNPDQAATENVGGDGLSLASLSDAKKAFAGIDPASCELRISCGEANIALTALVLAAFEDASFGKLHGDVLVDPLAKLALEGQLSGPLAGAFDRIAQLTLWAKDKAPGLRTIAVQVGGYQNSGANAVQEIAFALAAGVVSIRAMLERGLDIDLICRHMVFDFAIGADFFMEIAKFRAARVCWCQVVQAFGGNEESQKMRIHGRTSCWNKTEVDPWVNMLRVSTEAFSGIAGGVDSMHVGPFDEIFRTPNDFSRRIARNVQIMLREEAHFDKVVDPAGGCWYVETITAQLADKVWELFQEIEGQGGMLAALQAGTPQAGTEAVAAQRAKNIAMRVDRFVGTNMYPNLQEKVLDAEPFDHAAFQEKARRRLDAHIATVDKKACEEALTALRSVSGNRDGAVVDAAIRAARAGATLGELAAALQGADGESPQVKPLAVHRGAEPFERIRRTTEEWTARNNGEPPKLFLANMGPIPQHKARADFTTAFFNVGAIHTIGNDGFATVDEAARAALDSGARAVVICSTDATYPEIVPELTRQLKEANPGILVILAGYPKDHVDAFKAAGVDEFLHVRSNALELLTKLQKHLEVIA
ncbi:MAG: methylmalonyl-CoA mutase family protein [Desulfobulbus sp.]|jgi:methylmalonyl-CoA mutase